MYFTVLKCSLLIHCNWWHFSSYFAKFYVTCHFRMWTKMWKNENCYQFDWGILRQWLDFSEVHFDSCKQFFGQEWKLQFSLTVENMDSYYLRNILNNFFAKFPSTIIILILAVVFLGNYLSAKSTRYQRKRAWTWSSWYHEKLWGSCCFLLPTPTYRVGFEVCFRISYSYPYYLW